jgi:LysR family transcriptional regulator, benzoate and cis,cis-muconate-responsive activator of ben and cat genes
VELRHLRYFVGVANTLNFRAAAENLNVSAPALSRQIKDLEEEMGLRLFDRNTSKVRLTDAGLVFVDEARALLARASRAQEMAMDTVKKDHSHFRVGYNSALLAEFMPECLMTYAAKSPRVHVELIDLNAAEQVAAVKRGDIHLAFAAPQADWKLPKSLESVPVFSAKLQAVVGRGHRLASGSAVPLAELAKERILAISGPRWHIHRSHILTVYKSHGIPPPHVVEVERLDALLAMVAAREGVTLMIWRRCMAFPNQIVISPLKESGGMMELSIRGIWRKSTDSVVIQGFVATLRKVAARGRLEAVAPDETTFT